MLITAGYSGICIVVLDVLVFRLLLAFLSLVYIICVVLREGYVVRALVPSVLFITTGYGGTNMCLEGCGKEQARISFMRASGLALHPHTHYVSWVVKVARSTSTFDCCPPKKREFESLGDENFTHPPQFHYFARPDCINIQRLLFIL